MMVARSADKDGKAVIMVALVREELEVMIHSVGRLDLSKYGGVPVVLELTAGETEDELIAWFSKGIGDDTEIHDLRTNIPDSL